MCAVSQVSLVAKIVQNAPNLPTIDDDEVSRRLLNLFRRTVGIPEELFASCKINTPNLAYRDFVTHYRLPKSIEALTEGSLLAKSLHDREYEQLCEIKKIKLLSLQMLEGSFEREYIIDRRSVWWLIETFFAPHLQATTRLLTVKDLLHFDELSISSFYLTDVCGITLAKEAELDHFLVCALKYSKQLAPLIQQIVCTFGLTDEQHRALRQFFPEAHIGDKVTGLTIVPREPLQDQFLAASLFKQNEFDEALKRIDLSSGSLFHHLLAGCCHYRLESYEEAKKGLKATLALFEKRCMGIKTLVELLQRQQSIHAGQFQEQAAENARLLDWLCLMLAEVYCKMGKVAKADALLQEVIRRDKENRFAQDRLAILLIDELEMKHPRGDDKEGRLKEALSPQNAFALALYGQFLLDSGDVAGAKEYFRRSLQHDPKSSLATLGLAKAEWPVSSTELLLQALELDESCDEAHALLGVRFYEEGKLALSKEHLERAIAINPESDFAYAVLAGVHFALAKEEAAHTCLRRALDINPSNEFAHRLIKELSDPFEKTDDPLIVIDEAAQQSCKDPQELLFLKQKVAFAEEILERAVQSDPQNVQAQAILEAMKAKRIEAKTQLATAENKEIEEIATRFAKFVEIHNEYGRKGPTGLYATRITDCLLALDESLKSAKDSHFSIHCKTIRIIYIPNTSP